MKKLAAAFVGTSLFLAGCGSDQGPEVIPGVEAEVYNHYYDNRDLIAVKPIMYSPEGFYLDVMQCQHEDQKTPENVLGCIAIRVKVSEETYDAYPDGSTIVFAEE